MADPPYHTNYIHNQNWNTDKKTGNRETVINTYPISDYRNLGCEPRLSHFRSTSQSRQPTYPPISSFVRKFSSNSNRYRSRPLTQNLTSWSQMFSQIAPINEHLFLSGLQALSAERLRRFGITQIVTAMMDPLPLEILSAVSSHIQVSVEDVETSNLRYYFDSVADRIKLESKRGGKTLVHCMAGISRSSSLVLAYLISHENMSLADAYDHVKNIRPCIQPNVGFWKQLIAYEKSKRGKQTMCIVNDPIKSSNNRTEAYGRGNSAHLTLTSTQSNIRQYKSENKLYPYTNFQHYKY